MNEFKILNEDEGIPLFYPYVPEEALVEVASTLCTRWIGQGPKVDKFEEAVVNLFAPYSEALAVGSGTDALHLAYLLAGIERDDEVIVPVFTCTATNIPLLYIGATPVFADVDPETMNIDTVHVRQLISNKTKAIVCVDYGGYPANYADLRSLCDEFSLKLISDGAHSLGTKYQNQYACAIADFTIFSFQAIKTITTGDGGMLLIKDRSLLPLAKKLRWFGIDRQAKQGGIWENDIVDIGYKYQMTDIAAAMGLAALNKFDLILDHRKSLFKAYFDRLGNLSCVKLVPRKYEEDFCPWLITILVKDRIGLMAHLRSSGVESGQVHYRNDRYSIFGGRVLDCPNMDMIEDEYLVLPLHMRMTIDHVHKVCDAIADYFASK